MQGLGGQASGQRVLVLPGRERAVDFPNGPKSEGLDAGSARCTDALSTLWLANLKVVADRMEIEVTTEACRDSGKADIEFRVVTGLDVDEASLVRELSLELKAQTTP